MDALRAQLIDHEGLKLTVYRDSVGIETIGVGRNLRHNGISRHEAMMLLDNDIHECIGDLAEFAWFDRLDPVRQRVVLDLRFNLGPRRFRGFKHTIKAIADGRFGDAADGMLASKWASQVGHRAVRLARMMRLGVDA